MSRSPSLPDRPRLDLDPEMTPDERLEALREHFVKLSTVHRELESQLDAARGRQADLTDDVDRLRARKRDAQDVVAVHRHGRGGHRGTASSSNSTATTRRC